jgi:hypothetical protein
MPNRILKESICTSEDIDRLSSGAEILFYRLMVRADDFGTYYANESIVKNTCYPLKPDSIINVAKVRKWLDELEAAGLISRYAVDGRKYLWIRKWNKHQQIRAKKRKYPEPPTEVVEQKIPAISVDPYDCEQLQESDINCNQMISDDINCNQLQADDCNCSRNPIQSNPNPIRNPNPSGSGKTRFTPPTLEDVQAYCKERSSPVDPQKFYEYFTAGGWKDAKGNPVRNWKQKLLTWEQYQPQPAAQQKTTGNPFLRLLEQEGLK